MRNATRVLLGAALIAAFASGAKAADRAGVGLEWASGPTIPLGTFSLKIDNEFALGWKLSDNVSAEVFSGQGATTATHSYTSNVTPTGATGTSITCKETIDGTADTSGIRIKSLIPGLDFLALGLELGQTVMTWPNTTVYERSDGTAGGAGDFGGAPATGSVVGNLIGVNGKLVLVKGETKTVSGELSVGASLRFVDWGSRQYLLGTQDVFLSQPKSIDPVSNYNNLAITAGIGLWF